MSTSLHSLASPLTRRSALQRVLGAGAAATPLAWSAPTWAADPALPGKGVRVLPLKSNLVEETFQTLLVMKALTALGYDVQPFREVEYPLAHISVANGDATLIANHWNPHHAEFYKAAGGDANMSRKGVYSAGAAQGYMIDKKTADAHQITRIDQLADPKLAKLFDSSGDGKANLIGPNAGWGGEAVVEHHLTTFKLRNTVTYTQGNYPALIADTVARFKQGKPVLYYAWTPYWLSNVMRPGKDAVWLEVPFSAMPGVQAGMDTKQANGKNYGFPLNNQYIVGNKVWVDKNPAAAKLFEHPLVLDGDGNATRDGSLLVQCGLAGSLGHAAQRCRGTSNRACNWRMQLGMQLTTQRLMQRGLCGRQPFDHASAN